jgi:(R,R)-butanediol dehydrogenase / meso-butanediol dehydrogenase / diacetyl reductase
MSGTMQAVRIHGAGDVRLESMARPEPGPGEVLLNVTVAGICGTDATFFRHGVDIVPRSTEPRWPIALGHEFSGRVAALGDGVEDLTEGQLVASGAGVSCGHCARCLEGRTNLCQYYWTAGVHRDGGLAEYCAIPAATCEPAERHGVSGDEVGLAQPMSIAVHAVDRGGIGAGERALVIGAGGIGAFATWIISQIGAEAVVCDRDPARLLIAAALGAVRTEVAGDIPLTEVLADVAGFDVVYEMTGAPGPLAAAIDLVRPGGRVVAAGVQATPPEVAVARLTTNEIDLVATMAHVRATDLPRALGLIAARDAGWSDVAPEIIGLQEVVDSALPAFAAGQATRIKTLVDPSASAPRPLGS